MLIVVEQPLVDVRRMLETETGRIRPVDMRFPQDRPREFVRGLGAVERRLRRGIDPWIGEGHYVEAGNAVRFTSTTQWCEALGGGLKPVFRRLYSDGTVGRLEVGLRTPWLLDSHERPDPMAAPLASEVAIAALRLPVRVGGGRPTPLLGAGEQFAALLLAATTYTEADSRPQTLEPWWVTAGSPLALCELDLKEAPAGPAARWSEMLSADPSSAVAEQVWLTVDDRRVSLWLIVSSARRSATTGRQLRIHVSRLHAEHEAFRAVLRMCESKHLDDERSTVLRDYLDDRSGQLLKRSFGGFPQRELLDLVLDRWESSYRDDLKAMRAVEKRLGSRALRRKLEGVAEIAAGLSGGAAVQFVITNGGNPTVTQFDQSNRITDNTGNIAGVQMGGAGNAQHIGSIEQTSNDLGKLVDELVNAVAQLQEHAEVDEADASDASDLASSIKDEAGKTAPDKGKIKRMLGKLEAIAKKVGPPALTIISTVAAVAAVL